MSSKALDDPATSIEGGPSVVGCFVFVVTTPPLIRCRLRPAGRRVLPEFLTTERSEIEERPNPTHRLQTSPREHAALVVTGESEIQAFLLPSAAELACTVKWMKTKSGKLTR